MAPEVVRNALYVGTEVDIWSCGVILYLLLTGYLPFHHSDLATLYSRIQSGMYTMPTFLSNSSKDLIRKMLTVDPLKRATIPEIKAHAWFSYGVPSYISAPISSSSSSSNIDRDHYSDIDTDIVLEVYELMKTYHSDITLEQVQEAVRSKYDVASPLSILKSIQLSYNLLFDKKRLLLNKHTLGLNGDMSNAVLPTSPNHIHRFSSEFPPSNPTVDYHNVHINRDGVSLKRPLALCDPSHDTALSNNNNGDIAGSKR